MPPDSRGEKFDKPRGSYFTDYPLRPRQASWASPKFANDYCTPVPISTTGNSMLDVVVTPLSSTSVDNFACVVTNANVCQTVSGDTTTVSVLGARPTISISVGSQQTLSGNYPVSCTPPTSADALFSTTVSTSDGTWMGHAPKPAVSTSPPPKGSFGLLSTPFLSSSIMSTTLNALSQGAVVSTAAETGRVPISSVAGGAVNVANVALPVASTVASLPTANVVSPSSVPVVVVNTPKLSDHITGPQIVKASRSFPACRESE